MKEKNLNFDDIINRKNTDSIKFDFAEKNGKPADILPLWVADMDFKTSSLVIDAIKERADHGIFGYTDTGDKYFEAVSDWMKRHHGMNVEKAWLVKTPGVVFALATAVRAFTEIGDSILVQQPVYYPFSSLVMNNGRKLVSSELVLKDGKYQIDFDDFEQKIIDNNVKLFLLCSPHNPVGRVWTEEELKKMIDICLKHNVLMFSDEIHGDFTFNENKHVPVLNMTEEIKESCITATSPAKTFNLAGLQVSNIFIPNRKLRHRFKKEISAAGAGLITTMGITACESAYTYGEEWYDGMMAYLHSNLEFVREYVKNELPGVELVEPEGTYLLWLDFRELKLSANELEDLIVHKAKLWLDRGSMFGKLGEGFERINIATSRAVLNEAMDRIKAALKELR